MQAYKAAGMSDEQIAKRLGVSTSSDFEVLPICWQSVQVFLAMTRQWRVIFAPSGHRCLEGLDMSVLPAIAPAFGVSDGPAMAALIRDLRIMEEAACAVFRDRLERNLSASK